MPKVGGWSPDRDKLLTNLWGEGASASQIAAELAGVSRSAVCGRAWRLGLPPKKTVVVGEKNVDRRERRRKSEAKRIRLSRNLAEVPLPEPKQDPVDHRNLTFAEIRPFDCRWITNNDMAAPLYCGHHVKPGTSWCPYHADVVQPPRKTVQLSEVGAAIRSNRGRENATARWDKYRAMRGEEVA